MAPLPRPSAAARRLLTAELIAVGSELTVGETRDTNTGELARSLTEAGVTVDRLTALRDRRPLVEAAFRDALGRADLVVSTGGLGPTPDDLTREAIAAVCGETPAVDADLEAWLRGLWERRGIPFAAINLKQAWLIPSARAIPNARGTAPGWWVDRPDGRVAVLLPGPPREMRAMWQDGVLPGLRERGLGADVAVRTLRLWGLGESAVADRLGEPILRAENPEVATYARADAVDVRLSAVGETGLDGRPGQTAAELLDAVEPQVLAAVGELVWARGATTWAEAIGVELDRLGWRLATREHGTGGALVGLLGGLPRLARAEVVALADARPGRIDPVAEAAALRASEGVETTLVAVARPRGADTAVTVALETPAGSSRTRAVVFLGGEQGRSRAALTAADALLRALRSAGRETPDPGQVG